LLARGSRLTELLKQPQFKPVPVEEQVVAIFAGVRGYLDKVDVGRVGAFEAGLLAELKSREPAILETIRTDLELKPDTEKKLVAFLDNFSKSFS
jgi:F-type H+-transporting ATPase subunit alpha